MKKIVNNIIYFLQFIYLTYITILLSLVSSNIMERSKVMEKENVGARDSSYTDTELDVVNEQLQTFKSDMELKLIVIIVIAVLFTAYNIYRRKTIGYIFSINYIFNITIMIMVLTAIAKM